MIIAGALSSMAIQPTFNCVFPTGSILRAPGVAVGEVPGVLPQCSGGLFPM